MKPISHKRKAVAALFVAAAMYGCSTPRGIAWSFATPRRWVLAGDSPPLICGNLVVTFAFAAESDRIMVYGIDKDSGRQRWRVELPGNPHPPPPAVVGEFVFFAPGSRRIVRIDARDGSVETFDIDPDLGGAPENFWVVAAPGEAIFGSGKNRRHGTATTSPPFMVATAR